MARGTLTFSIFHFPFSIEENQVDDKYQLENGKWKIENGK
jgi:hypothetical protein